MNTGIVAVRYAKALLQYAEERRHGDKVYSQVYTIVHRMQSLSQLKDYLENRGEISLDRKLGLIAAALDEPLAEEVDRFVRLVDERRRMEYLSGMFLSFISQYQARHGIITGKLVTAVPSDALKDRLENVLSERTGADVRLEAKSDRGIIGGFIFELDGRRVDASVKGSLDKIRSELIRSNNRII